MENIINYNNQTYRKITKQYAKKYYNKNKTILIIPIIPKSNRTALKPQTLTKTARHKNFEEHVNNYKKYIKKNIIFYIEKHL